MNATAPFALIKLNAAPTARTRTIARLIRTLQADHGRHPTDAELAELLACSPEKIAHHRRIIRDLT
jgi:hypothetical protein